MAIEFRINNFDLLRLLAATQVVFVHCYMHLHLEENFWFELINKFPGVPVFFVISGYLISRSYEKNSHIKNYFRNRILRIYPGLWGCLIVTIITASIFGGINFINLQSIPWLLSQMIGGIYTPAMLKEYGFGSYNGALWTIPVELQFYILLPLVYYVMHKFIKYKYAFIALWGLFSLLAVFIQLYFPTMGTEAETKFQKLLRYSFLPHFWLFLTGVVLQRASIYRSKFVYGKGLIWLGIYLLFSFIVPSDGVLYLVKMLFLGFTTISLAYTYPLFSHKVFKGNDISYGVYIYHGIIINIFVELLLVKQMSYLWIILVITYILAFISWRLIEKPFLKKKVRTIHSRQ